MVASCAPHWGALLVSMHSFQARPGLPVSAWGRESAPLLHVSGTVPGAVDLQTHTGKLRIQNMNKELEEPQMPLRPIPYSEWMDKDAYDEMGRRYESLLSEYRKLLSIKNSQIEGVSPSIDEDKEVYAVEEYEMLLRKYATARDKYNGKYDGMIETKEMVRANIKRLYDAIEKYGAIHPDVDLNAGAPADFKEEPGESSESFKERFRQHMDAVANSAKQFSEAFAKQQEINRGIVNLQKELDGEISKFADIRDKVRAAQQAAFDAAIND